MIYVLLIAAALITGHIAWIIAALVLCALHTAVK